ncbi:MAG TPA: hypothetical protein VFO18_08825 [Methylomirabilota bacterium]|nr:hypothetical protein [Methylomirabilota bacterium]
MKAWERSHTCGVADETRVKRTIRNVALATVAVVLAAGTAAGQGVADRATGKTGSDGPTLTVPHTPSMKNFPCSKCHRHVAPNPNRRTLELAHTNISLRHAEAQRWCLDCHDGDKLRLPNGELVGYDQSYVLCGQCHGTVFRDWKAGVHGTRTGAWNGERYYRLCVSCHDAHQPRFKPIAPKPAPVTPADLRRSSSQ